MMELSEIPTGSLEQPEINLTKDVIIPLIVDSIISGWLQSVRFIVPGRKQNTAFINFKRHADQQNEIQLTKLQL